MGLTLAGQPSSACPSSLWSRVPPRSSSHASNESSHSLEEGTVSFASANSLRMWRRNSPFATSPLPLESHSLSSFLTKPSAFMSPVFASSSSPMRTCPYTKGIRMGWAQL